MGGGCGALDYRSLQEIALRQTGGGESGRVLRLPGPVWGLLQPNFSRAPRRQGQWGRDLVELHRAEHVNTFREQLLDVAQEVGVHWGTAWEKRAFRACPASRSPLSILLGDTLTNRPGCVAGCIAALLPRAAVHGEGPLAGVAALGLANALLVQEPHLVVEGGTAKRPKQGEPPAHQVPWARAKDALSYTLICYKNHTCYKNHRVGGVWYLDGPLSLQNWWSGANMGHKRP